MTGHSSDCAKAGESNIIVFIPDPIIANKFDDFNVFFFFNFLNFKNYTDSVHRKQNTVRNLQNRLGLHQET